MGKQIRLCVVSPLYHPSLGGLGRQAQLLTERLAEKGVDVFVIARLMKGMPPAHFSQKIRVYRAWSIKPYRHIFEDVNVNNILISLTFSMSCAVLLFLKRKEYDIVHFHGASLPLFFNLPILKILRKRVIAKVAAAGIGTEAGSLSGRYFGLGNLIIRLLKMADAFVATTSEIEEGLQKDGFSVSNIKRIPNFVDFSLFSPAPSDVKEEIKAKLGFGNSPIVTFSGRFIERKGINFLLEGWKEVVKKFPDAKLLLLGNGPLLADMKKMATGLGISNSVDFYGHIHQITDFLHVTDIFVLPSLQEGMPNSLLEAMACGLPVVATRIGGIMDVIQDRKNGIITNSGDPHGIADCIVNLLEDEVFALSLGREALHTIQMDYSLDKAVQRYVGLYDELIG